NRVGTYQTARSLALEAQNALCGWRPDGGWTPLEFEAQTTTRQQPTLILSLRLSTQLQLSDS
ncbi:MAG: hypothetical protein EB034_22220, partial [Verrucomicrobia bacterium]|nr:hypothetical protein [Verrucomicrobiota bacterium]